MKNEKENSTENPQKFKTIKLDEYTNICLDYLMEEFKINKKHKSLTANAIIFEVATLVAQNPKVDKDLAKVIKRLPENQSNIGKLILKLFVKKLNK